MTAAAIRIFATGGENKGTELPIEPWAVGVVVFGLLVVGLLITITFGRDR
jgi:hypothetical protein